MSKTLFNNNSGFTQIDNEVFFIQSVVSPAAFSLLIRIYRSTRGYGEVSKSLSGIYLQKTTNLSKNTVTRAIKELEKIGVVLVKRRSKLSSYYQVSVKGVAKVYKEVKAELEKSMNLEAEEGVDQEDLGFEGAEEVIEEVVVAEEVEELDSSFDLFWNKYDKKLNKGLCAGLWAKLSSTEQDAIMINLEAYIPSTPDKTFRKDPANYLKNAGWKDEVVNRFQAPANKPSIEMPQPPIFSAPVEPVRDVVEVGTEADSKINEWLKSFGKKGETYA